MAKTQTRRRELESEVASLKARSPAGVSVEDATNGVRPDPTISTIVAPVAVAIMMALCFYATHISAM